MIRRVLIPIAISLVALLGVVGTAAASAPAILDSGHADVHTDHHQSAPIAYTVKGNEPVSLNCMWLNTGADGYLSDGWFSVSTRFGGGWISMMQAKANGSVDFCPGNEIPDPPDRRA